MLKQCQKSQIREKREERALLKKVNAGDSNVGGTEKSGNPNWKGSEVEVVAVSYTHLTLPTTPYV